MPVMSKIPPGPINGSYSGRDAARQLDLPRASVHDIAQRLGLGTPAGVRLTLYSPADLEQIRTAYIGRGKYDRPDDSEKKTKKR